MNVKNAGEFEVKSFFDLTDNEKTMVDREDKEECSYFVINNTVYCLADFMKTEHEQFDGIETLTNITAIAVKFNHSYDMVTVFWLS